MLDVKKGIASLAIAGSLFGGSIVGVAAAPPENVQVGGAAGLVAAVVQAADLVDVTDSTIQVVNVENSLNNLTALNNVLNNSPILSNNEDVVDITVIDGDVTITDVLNDAQITALSGINVNVEDVVAVVQLLGGDFIVITD